MEIKPKRSADLFFLFFSFNVLQEKTSQTMIFMSMHPTEHCKNLFSNTEMTDSKVRDQGPIVLIFGINTVVFFLHS